MSCQTDTYLVCTIANSTSIPSRLFSSLRVLPSSASSSSSSSPPPQPPSVPDVSHPTAMGTNKMISIVLSLLSSTVLSSPLLCLHLSPSAMSSFSVHVPDQLKSESDEWTNASRRVRTMIPCADWQLCYLLQESRHTNPLNTNFIKQLCYDRDTNFNL